LLGLWSLSHSWPPLLLYVGSRLFALGVSRQIESTNVKHFSASISPTRAREALRFVLAVAMAIASYPHPINLQLRVSHWYPRNPERNGFWRANVNNQHRKRSTQLSLLTQGKSIGAETNYPLSVTLCAGPCFFAQAAPATEVSPLPGSPTVADPKPGAATGAGDQRRQASLFRLFEQVLSIRRLGSRSAL